jgi:hypothetical protein
MMCRSAVAGSLITALRASVDVIEATCAALRSNHWTTVDSEQANVTVSDGIFRVVLGVQ